MPAAGAATPGHDENNRVKLGFGLQVFLQGPAAVAAFEALGAASSPRLFIFIGCTLGCAGCAALLCQPKAGAWRLSSASARGGATPT